VPQAVIARRLEACNVRNTERGAALAGLFTEAGCAGNGLTEQIARKRKPPNRSARCPGMADPRIVVGAHFDEERRRSKGVIDNFNIHSLARRTIPILHSPRDKLDAVRRDDYYGSCRLILVYLAHLDRALARPAGTVESK
jgi:hypothetical protein